METHITVAVASLAIGWVTRALQREEAAPCRCQCGCNCESSLSLGSFLILGVGLVALVFIGLVIWLVSHNSSKDSFQTGFSATKGKKGVFGVVGKTLTITN